jgi:hypothetical protein
MNSTTLLRTVAAFLFASQDMSAKAQVPAAGNSERAVYEAVFYAPFSPRTALDMVKVIAKVRE